MIIFDVETTGLVDTINLPLTEQPFIIEFAALKVDDDLQIQDEMHFLCRPDCQIPEKITRITGITDKILSSHDPFPKHYQALCDFFLGEDKLVAHNIAFDRQLLAFELMRIDKLLQFPWPKLHYCSVEESRYIQGRRLRLSELYQIATGFDLQGGHRANADCKALLDCVRFLRTEGRI